MRATVAASLFALALAVLLALGVVRTAGLGGGWRPRPAGTVTTTPTAPVRP
jgi:hypothetical protein